MIKRIVFLCFIAVISSSCRNPQNADNDLKTVHIEQSPISDQGQTNHCWAYAFSSMLEAEARLRGDKDILLSPEHLVFHKIFDLISSQTYYEPNMMSGFAFDGGGPDRAATLTSKYGLVPSKIFDQKMEYQQPSMDERIHTWIRQNYTSQERVTYFNQHPDELRTELGKALNIQPLGPDSKFDYEGQTYTPLSFARERLKYDASLYQTVYVTPDNKAQVLEAIKASLMAGHTVLIGVKVFEGASQAPNPNSFDTSACTCETPCQIKFGHQVLLVDFETENGAFGPMSAEEAAKAAKQPITRLLAKNSWGTSYGVNQDGKRTQNNNGYFYVSADLTVPSLDVVDPQRREYFARGAVSVYLLQKIWHQAAGAPQ